MKKSLVAIVICCLAFMLSACAYTPEQKYMNFVADMDLSTRFDLCFDKVENGKVDFYIEGELRAIKHDIEAWDDDNGNAESANEFYIRCADALLESIGYYNEGLMDEYELALAEAKKSYLEASAIMVLINAGMENV